MDFLSLSPALKQPFFIGDGITSLGAIQQFVAPAGATRLFLGVMDPYGYSNNLDSFSVELGSPNAAPSGTDNTLTTEEDSTLEFTAGDFGFSDPLDSPPNNFTGVQITTLPSDGTLKLNGTPLSAGDFVTKAQIDAAQLTFDPAADENGTPYTTFTFQVEDDGAPDNLDPTPNTITINVNSVDDAPVLTGGGTPVTYVEDAAAEPVDPNLTLTDVDAGATLDAASVTITGNFVSGEDQLEFTNQNGISGSYNASTGVLSLTGVASVADYQTALRTVGYRNTSQDPDTSPRTVTFSLSTVLANPDNGHFYEFITAPAVRWDVARDASENLSFFGLQGYLATITSAGENAFAASKLQGVGWIGASDEAVEGEWRWVTGPEAGTQFWQGGPSGSTVGGQYANWNGGEPNNCCSGEDYGHMIFNPSIGPLGSWNDLPVYVGSGAYSPAGFVVEYGGMPSDPVLSLTSSNIVNVVPVNDAPVANDDAFTTSEDDVLSVAAAVLSNVALNPSAVATQSSTGFGGVASRAIDGNTDATWSHGSVTHTNSALNSYWEVSLGEDYAVQQIVLYNRGDCCGSRLSNFRVSVFDGAAEVFGQNFFEGSGSVAQGGSLTVPLSGGATGDRVRVQFLGYNNDGNGYLSLAEVEVYAAAGLLANDFDVEHDAFTLTEVNGSTANVGSQITLGSGALLTVQDNGVFSYDPNGQFDWLGAGQTTTDSFDYTIEDEAGATSTATAVITITGISHLSVSDASVVEGNAGDNNQLVFTVSLDSPAAEDVTIDYETSNGTAVAGQDYTATSGSLTIPAGSPSAEVTVDVTGENLVELSETLTLDVAFANVPEASGDVIIEDGSGQGTILNDDSAMVSIDDVSQVETDGGQTAFVFSVSLSAPVDTTVSMQAATADGSATVADGDYAAVTGQAVSFAAGSTTSQTVTVLVNGDTLVEPNQDFLVNFSNLTAGGRNVSFADDQGLATILNDDFLGGRVFDDLDNDGVFDPADGDAGIEGVLMQLIDEGSNTVVDTAVTGADGRYEFDSTLSAGSYKIVEGSVAGLLDGKETAGVNGGTVGNSQDSNEITGIDVSGNGMASASADYLFAEIGGSDLYGLVWEDFNNDGEVNFGEAGIEGVTLTLTGTDDRGNAVSVPTTTSGDGSYAFIDLRPGTYSITETQPAGYADGQESLGEVSDQGVPTAVADAGSIDGNDTFSGIVLVPKSEGDLYNFGERREAGGTIGAGTTATIGFWHNKNGQALIKSLNGGADSTQLGNWLAATFPEMYGAGAVYDAATGADQDMNLAGKTNAEVAEIFTYLQNRNKKTSVAGGPVKMDAQVLAVALATYATSENLSGGNYAASYGFNTSADGIAYTTFNVLTVMSAQEADDLGLTPVMDAGGNVTIIDILLATNGKAADGLLYDTDDSDSIDNFESVLRTLANELYTAINEGSDI